MAICVGKQQVDTLDALAGQQSARCGQLKITSLIGGRRRPDRIVLLVAPLHLARVAASAKGKQDALGSDQKSLVARWGVGDSRSQCRRCKAKLPLVQLAVSA